MNGRLTICRSSELHTRDKIWIKRVEGSECENHLIFCLELTD